MFAVDSAPITVGRGGQNDLVLDGDEFASARHARIEARGDGVWVQDLDSTNGTFVNGARVVGAERMSPGDVLRVGETDLRVEDGHYGRSARTQSRATRGAGGAETRTTTSLRRRCSPSPTGWAARRQARSRRGSRPPRSRAALRRARRARARDALIQEANRRIFDRASTDPAASGMGTTMTVALVEGMSVVIGHVGDSRAYLVRGDSMEQLTEDHSLVNELVKSGKLSEEEAQIHPQRSVITRAVGTDPDVDVDTFTIEAEDGDVFLLCSDGLTDMVEDVDILEIVDSQPR